MSPALHIAWFAWQLFGPDPPIVVSRETTYLTAPLRADGLPDYERYILEKMRAGVTPENNAAVLLLQALGPRKMKPEEFAAVAKEIGLDTSKVAEPPLNYYSDENYQNIAKWLRSIDSLPTEDNGENESALSSESIDSDQEAYIDNEILFIVGDQPWTTKECPPLAVWLKQNQVAIDLLVSASSRPRLHAPSPELLDESIDATSQIFPELGFACREAALVLSVRAMWHLGEGRHEKAWHDLRAVYRLSHLLSQKGRPVVDLLVAGAMNSIAYHGSSQLLNDDHLPASVAKEIHKDLVQLPQPATFSDTFKETERFLWIGALLEFQSNNLRDIEMIGIDQPIANVSRKITFDWNIVFRQINQLYDDLVSATKLPTWPEQRDAIAIIEKRAKFNTPTHRELALGLLSREYRSKLLADAFNDLLLPPSKGTIEAGVRVTAQRRLLLIAAALAQYRAENNRYPERLDTLIPKFFARIPLDPYNSEAFVYRKTPNGFLLYSLGPNAKDDQACNAGWIGWQVYRGYPVNPRLHDQVATLLGDEMPIIKPDDQEWPEGLPRLERSPLIDLIPGGSDDIAIRVPLPKLELPKAK